MKIFAVLASILWLCGCVAGQEIDLSYSPPHIQPPKQAIASVKVTVRDERIFVANGDKRPSYIGHYRAGYGNTWDVTTRGEIPLATQMENDLRYDLLHMGFPTLPNPDKTVLVTIKEWNFNTYLNGLFWYSLNVKVAARGKVLTESEIMDKTRIEGNIWVGAKYGMERDMPTIYTSIIRALVRDNPTAMGALLANDKPRGSIK